MGTDYPGADLNFSTRLGELTKIPIKKVMQASGARARRRRCPLYRRLAVQVLVRADGRRRHRAFQRGRDRATAGLPAHGGFLPAADYHGSYAREQFDNEIGRVLGHGQFPSSTLAPPDRPMWHTMFRGPAHFPQMASIPDLAPFLRGSTIERWNEDGSPPTVRGNRR